MKLPKFSSRLFLAPLARITDIAFRLRCLHYGAGLVEIPMINVNAIVRKNKATLDLLKTIPEEKPLSVQLFGTKTEAIKKAAQIVAEKTNCSIIDFNMGCPIKDILQQGSGAALLKRPAKIKKIVETLKSAVDIPVSIKIRIGGSSKSLNAIKNAQVIEDAGADFVVVHGRTVEQIYSGKVNYDAIKQVKESVSIPIVGNGDAFDEESAQRLFNTGCDYIMLGRGVIGRPWIFKKLNHFFKTGKKLDKEFDPAKEFEEYKRLANKFSVKPIILKQQAMYFTKGMNNATQIRRMISQGLKQDLSSDPEKS